MSTTKPTREDYMPQGGTNIYIRKNATTTEYKVGVVDDPTFEFAGETKDVDYHNHSTTKVVDGDKVNFTFKMYELRPELIAIIENWLSEVKLYDGATVEAGYPETFEQGDRGFGGDGSIILELPNASLITPTSITASVDGALAITTDYTLHDMGNGYTAVNFLNTGALATTLEAQTLTVVYTATPPKGSYIQPKSSGIAGGFILKTERKGEDKLWTDIQINNILVDCKPDKPFTQFAGDTDDKGAYKEIKVLGTVFKEWFVWFE